MNYIIYFDIASIIITTFLFSAIIVRNQLDGLNNKLYFMTIILVLIASIFDILGSQDAFSPAVLTAMTTLYMFFRVAFLVGFFLYASSLSKTFYKMLKKKSMFILSLLPYLIYTILLIVNIPTKIIFGYNEGPVYFRGTLSFITYIIGYGYALAAIAMMIGVRKYYTKQKILMTIFALLGQTAASIIQIFFSTLLLEMFGAASSLLFLTIFVERSEDYIDYKTQLPNFNSFYRFLNRTIGVNEEFSVIIAHVTNISSVYNIYAYDDALAYLRSVSMKLNNSVKEIDNTCHVYFSDQNSFIVAFFHKDKGPELLKFINNYLNNVVDNKSEISFRSTLPQSWLNIQKTSEQPKN